MLAPGAFTEDQEIAAVKGLRLILVSLGGLMMMLSVASSAPC